MKKHIAPPATAEQIQRTLGVTREDLEIVNRIMREMGYYEDEDSLCGADSSGESSGPNYKALKKDD